MHRLHLVLTPISQLNLKRTSFAEHMHIGSDESLTRNDEAGTDSLPLTISTSETDDHHGGPSFLGEFCDLVGVAKRDAIVEMQLLEHAGSWS